MEEAQSLNAASVFSSLFGGVQPACTAVKLVSQLMTESVQMQTDRLILIFVFPLYNVCEETTQERGCSCFRWCFTYEISNWISIKFGIVTFVITEASGDFSIVYIHSRGPPRPKIHEAQSHFINFLSNILQPFATNARKVVLINEPTLCPSNTTYIYKRINI